MDEQEPTVDDLKARIAELEENMAVQAIVAVRYQQLYANEVATSTNLGARLQRHLERSGAAAGDG